MVAAIKHRHLDIDHRIPRQKSPGGGLANPFLHRRNILPRNCAAEDVVRKHHSTSTRQGLHANLAVAILTMPTGLLLIPALSFGASANACCASAPTKGSVEATRPVSTRSQSVPGGQTASRSSATSALALACANTV